MKYISIIIILTIFIFGCNKDNTDISKKSITYQDYYPTNTFQNRIYKVQKIIIDVPSEYYDTLNYYIKEVFDSVFIDAAGDTAICIKRFQRMSEDAAWQISDIWFANVYENELHIIEENIRYVKLKNPVQVDYSWDGNLYNTIDSLHSTEYWYSSINTNIVYNNLTFDSVVVITQLYDSTLIDKLVFQEKYAKNIGLIYKEEIRINSQTVTAAPIEQRITTAEIFKMQIIDYE